MKIENSVFIFNIQSKFPLYFVKKEAKFVSRYLNEMHMNEIFETLILHSFSKLAKVGIKISRKPRLFFQNLKEFSVSIGFVSRKILKLKAYS